MCSQPWCFCPELCSALLNPEWVWEGFAWSDLWDYSITTCRPNLPPGSVRISFQFQCEFGALEHLTVWALRTYQSDHERHAMGEPCV